MTQQAPPLLSYATPSQQPLRSFAKTLAIIGICIGSLELIADGLGLYNSCVGFRLSYYRVAFAVFAALAAALIAASIGCLKAKPAARVWLVRYAIAYLIACVLELVVAPLIELTPGLLRFGDVVDPQVVGILMMNAVRTLVVDAFTGVLPIVILICMRTPKALANSSGTLSVSSNTR